MLHIRLFGQVECVLDDTLVPLPPSAQMLLAYLALENQRPHSREHLATCFWPDIEAHYARTNLRKTLWKLQHALSQTSAIAVQHDTIALNPAHATTDCHQFEDAFQACRNQPGSHFTPEQCTLAHDAVALYRGDLLEALYTDWCLIPREHYRHMYLVLLEKLLAYSEQTHAFDDGIAYAHQVLRQEPAHERVHCTLMRLFYLSGNRAAALRQFQQCRHMLATEYQATPAQSTRSLVEAIRNDDAEAVRLHALGEQVRFCQQTNATAEHLQSLEADLETALRDVRIELARLRPSAPPAHD
nr:BTAD domain-containing putative transcriptional regulator [Ardenticatena sp.]